MEKPLEEAIEWKDLADRLTQAEARHAPAFGDRYYPSRSTVDLDEIDRAVALADRASLAPVVVACSESCSSSRPWGVPDPQLLHAATTVQTTIEALRRGAFGVYVGERITQVEALLELQPLRGASPRQRPSAIS